MNAQRPGQRGFTLVEMLVALAMFGALMAAISQFVLSLAGVWASSREQFVFAAHCKAVGREVQRLLDESARSATASASAEGAPAMRKPAWRDEDPVERLTFDLPAEALRLAWADCPLPEVRCAIAWRTGAGLVLAYQSRLVERYQEIQPRTWVISPLVVGISYDYYRSESGEWLTAAGPERQGDRLRVPQRLRLKFKRGGLEREEHVMVPTLSEGVMLF